MLLVTSLLKWWYTEGLHQRINNLSNQLYGTLDYFSLSLLVKTFFSPFRQISAGKVDGPIGVQIRTLADNLVSRVIGAGVRAVILLIGVVIIILELIWGAILFVGWLIFPAVPLIGIIFSVMGLML